MPFLRLVLLQAAKTTERGDLRLLLARSNGVDENPVRREGTGERSPPSSSAKRVSLASAFVLLGVKKPAPERSSANAAAGKGKGKPPPTPRLCRDGNEMDGASKHPPECPDKKGKTSRKKNQQRDGLLPGAAPSSQGTFRHPCRGEQAEKKIAEQAAKMAERRKRCVGCISVGQSEMFDHVCVIFATGVWVNHIVVRTGGSYHMRRKSR